MHRNERVTTILTFLLLTLAAVASAYGVFHLFEGEETHQRVFMFSIAGGYLWTIVIMCIAIRRKGSLTAVAVSRIRRKSERNVLLTPLMVVVFPVVAAYICALMFANYFQITRYGETSTATVVDVWEASTSRQSDTVIFELPDGSKVRYIESDTTLDVGEVEEILYHKQIVDGIARTRNEVLLVRFLPLERVKLFAVPTFFVLLYIPVLFVAYRRSKQFIAQHDDQHRRMAFMVAGLAIAILVLVFLKIFVFL